MTSKEALKIIKKWVNHFVYWKTSEYFKTIQKDLEVLEIFRKYIEIDYDEDGKLNMWGFSGIDLQQLSPNELKIIERWLENDK